MQDFSKQSAGQTHGIVDDTIGLFGADVLQYLRYDEKTLVEHVHWQTNGFTAIKCGPVDLFNLRLITMKRGTRGLYEGLERVGEIVTDLFASRHKLLHNR